MVGTAQDSTNATAGRLLVLYVSLTTGRLHARTYGEFHEILHADAKSGEQYDPPRPRFQRVSQPLTGRRADHQYVEQLDEGCARCDLPRERHP